MAWFESAAPAGPEISPKRRSHMLWRWLGLVLALLLAWALVRAYQAPDFVLDFAVFRLC